MYKLIEQRESHECMVACLAMATTFTYEYILENLNSEAKKFLSKKEGFYFTSTLNFLWDHNFDTDEMYVFNDNWDKVCECAILMVNSLNKKDKKHVVFWDGNEILDPSKNLKYTKEEAFLACEYVVKIK